MSNTTPVVDQIRRLMDKPSNIRNISIIGNVNQGKSTLAALLVSKADLISFVEAGFMRLTDIRPDEKERSRTIKSTAIPLCFEMNKEDLEPIKQDIIGKEFLISLIDTPGRAELSSEVSAALRISDGALVVIDAIEGVSLHTETLLRQALAERIKPVVVINKVDQLLALNLSKEETFQYLKRIIEEINIIISTYDTVIDDWRVHPEQGSVGFGSGLQGWTFTLRQFATRYSKKFGVDKKKMMGKLWGDNYFNHTTRKWTTENTDDEGNPLERAFNAFVLEPILKIFNAVMSAKPDSIENIVHKLDITLAQDELDLKGEQLLSAIMRQFLPAGDALLQTIVLNLPSPVTAQRYRVETLYEGPMNDECAIGIRTCDPNGPLVLYVSKMMRAPKNSDDGGGRFYALGRVFSGTIRSGPKIRIQGTNYVPGRKDDLFIKSILRIVLLAGPHAEAVNIEDCPAGNIIALVGIDQFLFKSGTLTSLDTAYNIKAMKFSVLPVMQIAVKVRNVADLPKLVEGLKRLSKSDQCVQTWIAESGDHIVAGASEAHLDICLTDLEDTYAGIPLKRSKPVVGYRENVRAESSMVAHSKTTDKSMHLYVKARPIHEKLVNAIETGKIGPSDNYIARARILANDHGWDATEARRIWCFGPDKDGPNLLVDVTKGVKYLNEIRDRCVSGFQWATREGVCAEENMRGVRFDILDVTYHATTVYRGGGGQVMSACRRVCHAAALLAAPGLQEPIYLVDIRCPDHHTRNVYTCLSKRRGRVFSEEQRLGGSIVMVKAYMPAAESFNFDRDLRSDTQGQANAQKVFDHWKTMPGSPIEKGSELEALVRSIRIRKGLKSDTIPPLGTYHDEL